MKIYQNIQKFPGGMMVVPLLLGSIIGTFFPQALSIGGMTTALFKGGAGAIIAMSLFCVGSQISVREAAEPLKRGAILLFFKFLAGFIPTLIVKSIWGPEGVLGITPLMLLCAVTNSNGGLYMGLVGTFGDEDDLGAQSLLGINDGPFLALIGIGAAGLGSFDAIALVASIVPIVVGMILGNLDKDMAKFLGQGIAVTIPFFAFPLGASINLTNVASGGIKGIFLGFLVIALTALFVIPADRKILKRPGYAGAAVCTTAGNAVAVPALVAEIAPAYAPQVQTATTAVAAAVVITTIFTPIFTSWVVKKWGSPKYNAIKESAK